MDSGSTYLQHLLASAVILVFAHLAFNCKLLKTMLLILVNMMVLSKSLFIIQEHIVAILAMPLPILQLQHFLIISDHGKIKEMVLPSIGLEMLESLTSKEQIT
jgi:hypothetical protein